MIAVKTWPPYARLLLRGQSRALWRTCGNPLVGGEHSVLYSCRPGSSPFFPHSSLSTAALVPPLGSLSRRHFAGVAATPRSNGKIKADEVFSGEEEEESDDTSEEEENNDLVGGGRRKERRERKQGREEELPSWASWDKNGRLLLRDSDLEETFAKGSGPGGQKINKVRNNVILKHNPTGVAVQCQETRSLTDNRSIARKRLTLMLEERLLGKESRLGKRASKERDKKRKKHAKAKKKAQKVAAERANGKEKDGLSSKA